MSPFQLWSVDWKCICITFVVLSKSAKTPLSRAMNPNWKVLLLPFDLISSFWDSTSACPITPSFLLYIIISTSSCFRTKKMETFHLIPALVFVNSVSRKLGGLYLEDVTLCELEGARSDVDAFSSLDLNAVHTLVAVVVVHRIVWWQQHSLVVGDSRTTLSCTDTQNRQ